MSTARRAMKAGGDLVAALVLLMFAGQTEAATLTITADKSVYKVGGQIVLSVFGDSEGEATSLVFGRLLFDPNLAIVNSVIQDPLSTMGIEWITQSLEFGAGFSEVFEQLLSINPNRVDGPLTATLVLTATATGTLDYTWDTDLSFFTLREASGGSVTIVPEPATGLLLALGLGVIVAPRFRSTH